MNISLDFDGTYTADPAMWDEFIGLAQRHGHSVKCVTMRYPTETVEIPCEVIYTSRKPKKEFYSADVWIDDMPHFIFMGGA